MFRASVGDRNSDRTTGKLVTMANQNWKMGTGFCIKHVLSSLRFIDLLLTFHNPGGSVWKGAPHGEHLRSQLENISMTLKFFHQLLPLLLSWAASKRATSNNQTKVQSTNISLPMMPKPSKLGECWCILNM